MPPRFKERLAYTSFTGYLEKGNSALVPFLPHPLCGLSTKKQSGFAYKQTVSRNKLSLERLKEKERKQVQCNDELRNESILQNTFKCNRN